MKGSYELEKSSPRRNGSTSDRFGDFLSRQVPLTRHQIFEILEEQGVSHRKFGQIALSWGLCEPLQVWKAWAGQLVGRTQRVDLDKFGIDAQATVGLPAWAANALGIVPVRLMDDGLILAASEASLPRASELLATRLDRPISFVIAEAGQIDRAVRRYYPQAVGFTDRPAGSSIESHRRNGCAGAKRCGGKCRGSNCPSRRQQEVGA